MNTIVKLKKLTPNAIIPTYGTAQSAGADLYSGMEQPVTIEPGKTEFIHTGIAIAIPEGLVGLVYARSGMACKKALPLPTRSVSLMPITAVKSWLHSITTEMKLLPLNRATALHSLY